VPVSGIWSLPLLSQKVLGRLGAKSGHVLLISQQVSSNVRQSYFKDGKLVSSRLATLMLEGGLSYGKFLQDEIEQTTRFLNNKRYLGFDQSLHVHIIPPDEHIESVKRECVNTSTRTVVVHRVQEVEKKVATQGTIGPYGNGIFAQLCNDDHFSRGHYGGQADFATYNYYVAGKALQGLAAVIVLGSALLATNMFFKTDTMQQAAGDIRSQAAIINGRYQRELQKFEPQLQQAALMQASVELAGRVVKNKQASPQNFLVWFSRILGERNFSMLDVTEIDWQIQADQASDAGASTLPLQLQESMPRHVATITGHAPVNADNLRAVVEQINALAERLRQDKKIISVQITKLPVDVRPSANVSMQLGNSNTEQVEASEFSLQLTMKGDNA